MEKLKFFENNYLGRITATHNGSGQINSWNWNSSNFHADDVLDSSYTNEKHTPLYSLDDFPENQIEVSNIVLGLLKNNFKGFNVPNIPGFRRMELSFSLPESKRCLQWKWVGKHTFG